MGMRSGLGILGCRVSGVGEEGVGCRGACFLLSILLLISTSLNEESEDKGGRATAEFLPFKFAFDLNFSERRK
jgi:hypothetical protein